MLSEFIATRLHSKASNIQIERANQMGSVTLYEFIDTDSSLESNDYEYHWPVDFGEGGETEVAVDVDCIISSDVIGVSSTAVTVDTEILAGELINQGELEEIVRNLCAESSLDAVFDVLVEVSPDYEDE